MEKYSGNDERMCGYPFVNALTMNGGDGDNSYSTNSILQVSSAFHKKIMRIQIVYSFLIYFSLFSFLEKSFIEGQAGFG